MKVVKVFVLGEKSQLDAQHKDAADMCFTDEESIVPSCCQLQITHTIYLL